MAQLYDTKQSPRVYREWVWLRQTSVTSDYEEAGTTGPDSPPRKKVKRHHVDSKYQPQWSRKYRIVINQALKY